MGLKINLQGDEENLKEIFDILHRFADHSKFCDTCNVQTGKHCHVGYQILVELTKFKEVEGYKD